MTTDAYVGEVLDDRYEIVRPLGAGAMGAVYLARQVWLDRPVAIKVLRADVPVNSRARRRLHREARVVGRISNPHVVQVHDYGQAEDGAPYLVMEYVRGTTPSEALGGTTELAAVMAAIDGVLEGLGAAHARGVLHRDLKPANMIVRGGDPAQVVLLDFGIAAVLGAFEESESTISAEMLARETAGEALTHAGTVMGTPLYMAPEQARGARITERSDLYAAGVVLYEWLAGTPPFRGPVREVMRAHVFDPPPRLRPRPGLRLPDGLIAVVERTLAKDPAARYGSAAEMRRALRRASGPPARAATATAMRTSAPGAVVLPPRVAETLPVAALSAANSGGAAPAVPTTARMMADPPFMDREREASWLSERLAEAAAGRGGLALVDGPGGIGKSRLVSHVLDDALAANTVRVGRSAASPGGGPALGGIRGALEDLLQSRRLAPAGLVRRLGDVLGGGGEGLSDAECAHLADWLRGGQADVSTGPVRPESPLEWQEQALVERALRILASTTSVVLWLDDLHWADAATVAFLTRLAIAQRLHPFGLLVVATRDPAEPGASASLLRYGGDVLHRLELEPLPQVEVESLLRTVMALDATVATQLAVRADGSPLHALQLLRHLTEQGRLTRVGEAWTLTDEIELSGLVPASMEQMLAARLDGVLANTSDPDTVGQVLEAAAVLGPGFDVKLLERVIEAAGADSSRVDDAHVDELLDELVDGGLLTEPDGGGDRLSWEHPMLRDLVLSRMGSSRRGRRLCRAAAESLLAEHPTRDVARPVVELLLLAGDRDGAAAHAAEGGRQALAAGDLAEAVRLFAMARKRGGREVRIEACWGQGNAENHLGHTDRAEECFAAILEEEPSPEEAAWAWFGVGRCRYNRGAPHEALAAFSEAMALLDGRTGPDAAQARSKILRTLAAAAAELPDVPVPDPDPDQLLADAPDALQRSERYTTLGYVALARGDRAAAVRWLDQALGEARAGGSHPALPDILCDLGRANREAGDLGAADRHLTEGLALARTSGQHRTEAELHNELGELARARGDLHGAANHYRAALTLWRLLGSRHVLVGTLNQALVAVDAGRPEEALDVLDDAPAPDGEARRAALLLTRALALAAAGNDGEAADALEEGVALQARFDPPHDEAVAIVERVAGVWTRAGNFVMALPRRGPGGLAQALTGPVDKPAHGHALPGSPGIPVRLQ